MYKMSITNHVCIICYSNENFTLKCADKSCNSRICEECFEVYLNHCLSEKSLVNCLNQYCKSYIISDSFKNKNTYSELYKKVLLSAFINSQGPEIIDKINVCKLIDDLKKERKQFIKIFPKAIELVVTIALHKKMNNVTKNNKLYLKTIVEQSNRICMISHCNGKLNKKFECLKCMTKFCKNCEKIEKENHVCKDEDIESLKFVNTIIKCPKCHVSIERSEGCSDMTCASCKTNFNYLTGELGGGGNHGQNQDIMSQLYKKTNFTFDFKKNYNHSIQEKLFIIENNEQKEPSIIQLNNVIKKLIEQTDKEQIDNIIGNEIGNEIGNDVLRVFEKYLKNRLNYINFISATVTISELHTSDDLTEFHLENIINKNKWDRSKSDYDNIDSNYS